MAVFQPNDEFAGRTLTLAECIDIALERNPQAAGSWQAARAAAARTGQAKSEYLPTVGFSSSVTRGDAAELDDRADPGAQNRYDALFGVRYLLFDGGGREARVQGAEAGLLAANFRYDTVLQNIALSVEEAYYNLLGARNFRDLAVETVKQREYHLQLADARYRTGLVAKSDVLKAQTEKADADLKFVSAENAYYIARGRLAVTMGLRVSVPFDIAVMPENAYQQEAADIESLLEEAARCRPELQAMLAEIDVQRKNVRGVESRFRPSVVFDAGGGWLGRSFVPGQEQWSFGLSVEFPLFTGHDRTYQIQRSKADLSQAVFERLDILQDVELEVWTAYRQTIEAGQAIDAAERLVASAEESSRVAEGEYKNGTGSIIGLIDAQTALTGARSKLIQARLDWHTAMSRLERAVGRTLANTEAEPMEKSEP